jgi:enediyne biosynthesis protein E5
VERVERDGEVGRRRAILDGRRRRALVGALSGARPDGGPARNRGRRVLRIEDERLGRGTPQQPSATRAAIAASAADPRTLQIAALGVLLLAGASLRDFAIRPEQCLLAFAAALATQQLGDRLSGAAQSGAPSALVTGLSLSLLLRADGLWAHPIAAIVAVGAKFVVRARGKHLFNPGNLGVILALLCLPGTWVSPGQWGDDFTLAGWFVALGGLVVHRARRADVSVAFLGFHLGFLALRVLWLGQRLAVLAHQLQSGALLLFAFFMISDPRTIPDDRRGRIAHAALVAAVAHVWQLALYRPNGLLWALFFAAPAVPLWDALWPAERYRWGSRGDRHEKATALDPGRARARRARLARAGA